MRFSLNDVELNTDAPGGMPVLDFVRDAAALTGYLLSAPRYSVDEALIAVAGNLCRCTGYASIRRAIAELVDQLAAAVDPAEDRIAALIREEVLPARFGDPWTQLGASAPQPETPLPPRDRTVVAGGTDLYVQRADDLASSSPYLIRRALPSRIWTEDGWVHISATTTAEELKWSPEVGKVIGGIKGFMDLVCSLPIRHQATVAGNIVNASPIGDMTILLLALDAELGMTGDNGRRVIPLRQFFKGYKELDLADHEMIEWIRFRRAHGAARYNFEKVCRRRHLDIASVNSAACLHTDDGSITEAHLSAGGVAPIPLKLERTEALLIGKPVSAATAREAAAAADSEISPISDVRGSADYKRLLLKQLILAHFHVLFGIEDGLTEEAIA
jgi:xanthine dehydrogenase small subunit